MKKLLLLFIFCPLIVICQIQIGQDINGEQGRLLNDFGYSVSSSSNGNIIAIGAPLNNANGVFSGHVKVYENIGGFWTQIGSDIEGDAEADEFGYSVSLSSDGSILAVGAIGNDQNGSNSGHVRIFKNIGGIWTQVGGNINGEATEDEFGYSVSLSSNGSIIAIGATKHDTNGSNSGHVSIYENIEGVWTQVGNDIDGETGGDQSGYSVSLSSNGNIVAIGAPLNDGNGILSGHVRIYENIGDVWMQIGNDIDGEEQRDRSGSSISLSSDGSIVAIGASRNDANGFNSGHVRVYENIDNVWTQIGNDIDGEDGLEFFGESLSLSSDGSILAIGSIQGSNNNGYVRLYENIGGFWSLIGNAIEGETVENQSGRYITLNRGFSINLSSDGTKVAIGTTENDGNGYKSGHVRNYENMSNVWTQIGNDINGERTHSPDQFGYSTSISSDGTIIAVAANKKDNGIDNIQAGQVIIYESVEGTWTQAGNKINGKTSFDCSGESLSLSADGSIVAIGASRNGGNGIFSGHVRIFENIGGIWTQIGDDINGEAEFDGAGSNISLSSDGNIIAIAALGNDGNGNNSGHVRIYENINGIWTQIGSDIDGQDMFDQFGDSLSLSSDGSIVAIGSLINNSDTGYIKIYKNIENVWTQIGNTINGEEMGDRLGYGLSLSSDGNIVAFRANVSDGNIPEVVRIYENINNSWIQVGNDIIGETIFDFYGGHISLSPDGNIVAIGPSQNSGNIANSSKVKLYKNIEDSWIQVGIDIDVFTGRNPNFNEDLLPSNVALSTNGKLVIGSSGNDTNGINSGQVRVYSFASELALLEVVEDITGNSNGINVTADQLNSIEGVSGAIEGVNYTTALQNGTFLDSNNPTALEVQTIIDQVNASLSITSISTFEFQLYPNPTKTYFTIQLDNSTELVNINIYNNLGQSVLNSKETVINTLALSVGLYIVEIETNKGKVSKKLIIE